MMIPVELAWSGVYVHPLAVVDDTNTIGPGTKIWSGALVRNGTILGSDVSVGIGCALEGSVIGDGTHLNPHCLAGVGLVVGKRCFLGGHVVLCNDAFPSVDRDADGGWYPSPGFVTVRVGDDTAICTGAIILPGVTIGNRCLVAAGAVCGVDVPDDHMFLRDGRIKPIDRTRIERMKPI